MKPQEKIIHNKARELLQFSWDGSINDEQHELLMQHLDECLECRTHAAEMSLLDQKVKLSLGRRWPEQQSSDFDPAAVNRNILSQVRNYQSKLKVANTIRSLGWAAVAVLLVVGLVWTIKNLAPIPPQGPAGVATSDTTPAISPPTEAATPTIQLTPQVSVGPMPGQWVAVTDFGKLILTIDDLGTSIIRTDFQFSLWECGSITHTGDIVDASSWLITNNQFSLISTFDGDAQVHMSVNGMYDESTHRLSGTWEESATAAACSGTWDASLPASAATILPSGPVGLLPSVSFSFSAGLPASPEMMTLYHQQLSQQVTSETARQAALLWGINAGIYTSPSEGMNDTIFVAMDGSRTMRFLNFPDQFIYEVGYTSPDYGSALMDNGPLPSFDEQVAIATNFLKPFGILNLPYRTMPLETERGMVAFIPLLDGYPVIQEIGVDRSNIGWIDVKVSTPGQVTMVQYSAHDFQPVASYPILDAQQAWDRFTNDIDLQHSRYALLSPKAENTYQSWERKYAPGQQADIYGWVNTYSPADPDQLKLVVINNLPIIGDTASLIPANQVDVRFVHAWGQVQGSPTDGIALRLSGWEASSLSDIYITGTITTQSGEIMLLSADRILALVDPPSDIPDGTQVGIQGVVLEGDPARLSWKFIETGEIPFTYGASSSCGGYGAGGNASSTANFGAGSFALLNLDGPAQSSATQAALPYQPGDELNSVSGRVYITQHLYLGGNTSTEVIFSPDPSSAMNMDWGYSLIGDFLFGIDQYNNLPIKVWGQVDRIENHLVYIAVTRYEPVYPGEVIQVWTGTEQILTLDGREVVLFTTSTGESYVLKSSVDYPPANANIIGRLGNIVEIEGYVLPDQSVGIGGYLLLQDTAGSAQPDGVAESSQVYVWDHSQDPSSNPGAILQGQVTIDNIELAYDAINLDRCQASSAEDPNMAPWLYVQPMWQFSGHFEDGRRFIAQVQALPDQYFK